MGKIFSLISKPIKNYNIESRAHKIISKDKPVAAPKHKGTLEESERILRDNPDSLNELLRKDANLDARLRDVFVKSHDPVYEIKQDNTRALPLNRKPVESFEFGFNEPDSIPVGRCTLRQAVSMLTKHQEDSTTWNSTKLAIDYKIPEEKITNILHYFRVYKLYIPEKKPKNAFAAPSIPKQQIGKHTREKVLNSGKEEKND